MHAGAPSTAQPDRLHSPATVQRLRAGDAFDLATFLVSLLRGYGFDAYCVCGTAAQWITERDTSQVEWADLTPEAVMAALEQQQQQSPPAPQTQTQSVAEATSASAKENHADATASAPNNSSSGGNTAEAEAAAERAAADAVPAGGAPVAVAAPAAPRARYQVREPTEHTSRFLEMKRARLEAEAAEQRRVEADNKAAEELVRVRAWVCAGVWVQVVSMLTHDVGA